MKSTFLSLGLPVEVEELACLGFGWTGRSLLRSEDGGDDVEVGGATRVWSHVFFSILSGPPSSH